MLGVLFDPRSIAVIGASQNTAKIGYVLVDNLLKGGYRGAIHPVSRSGGSILGLKVCEGIGELPGGVDLAIISIPAPGVPDAIRECIAKSVPAAIVISAGFKETGAEGAGLEMQMKGIARKGNIRILGPNCLGAMNTGAGLNATFAKWMLPKGNIAFFSQSGALGVAVLDWAIGNKIGFSKFVSLGNKVDLNETDMIEYLMDDPETSVILGYIEDVVEGKRFIEVARKCTSKKPVVLIKSGGTQAGARAASSHTGALAGSETAFTAAFKQTGVIRAGGVQELFELARAFSTGRIPCGNRLLILTNAGGPGIIAADQAERIGLTLPLFSNEALGRMREKLPPNASLYNPIDVIGDATSKRYRTVVDEFIKSEQFDAMAAILTPQAVTDVDACAEVIAHGARMTDRPIIASFMGGISVQEAISRLNASGVPNYSYPEDSIKVLGRMVEFSARRSRPPSAERSPSVDSRKVKKFVKAALAAGKHSLLEEDAREALEGYGFRFPKRAFAPDGKSAARESASIGFPVVMKIASPDVLHKTDVGGVRLSIKGRAEAEAAFTDITASVLKHMPHALVHGVNIYEMLTGPGKEVIIGLTFDRTFGHMLMFGLGGIYVEVLKDVSFRVVPTGADDIREMLAETRTYGLLRGARGEAGVDTEAIVDALVRLNRLALDCPEVHELDINPLVVRQEGAIALDARIIVHGG